MDFKARVRQRITEMGISDAEVARRAGRNNGYVRDVLSRTKMAPRMDSVKLLAAALETTPEWLLGEHEPATLAVPVFDVKAAAGDGALIETEDRAGALVFDRSYLRTMTNARADQLSIIQCWGDSMSPTVPEGAWVMIDHTQTEIVTNRIYAFRDDDDAKIKRLLRHPTNGTLTLHSDNERWAAIENVDPTKLNIIGRAIWYSKKLV